MKSTPTKRNTPEHKRARSSSIAGGRWAAYAAAGVASTVAFAPSAEAEVHYSGIVKYDFPAQGGHASFPLAPGVDLEIGVGIPSSSQIAFADVFIDGANGLFAGTLRPYHGVQVYSLARRVALSGEPFPLSCRFNSSSSTTVCYYGSGALGNQRAFRTRGQTFFGFKFTNETGQHYGWARLRVSGAPKYRFELVDYAWADAGEPLQTGQTTSAGSAAINKFGSLGLLAAGAAGVKAWRAEK